MKKRLVLSISIFLLAMGGLFGLLAGCSNLTEDEEPTPPATTGDADNGTAVGAPTTSFAGKVIRVFLDLPFAASSARSAAPSSDAFGSGANNFVFAVALHASGAAATLEEAAYTPATASELASVAVPFEVSTAARANYVLDIYAFASGYDHSSGFAAGGALLFGQASGINIPANAYSVEISDPVKMRPYSASSANGSVELAISIPAGHSLSCDNPNFSCTSSSISAASIAPGEYNVTFSVTKNGEPVYVWSEMIYVYPGLKTDTWNSGTVNASGAREISNVTMETAFFVRGTGGGWIAGITSAAGDDTAGNGSLAKPYATINKAIDKITAITTSDTDSYTIYVDGTVTGTTTISVTTTTKISIEGLGTGSNVATLDGNNAGIAIIASGTNLNLTLKNLKITKGKGNYGGGVNNSATLNITDCEISGNSATYYGGGIYNTGTLTMSGGTISGNTAETGGGGIHNSGGTFKFISGTISGNTANGGGGIYNNSGTFTMSGGTISDNTATSNGGGIYNNGTFTMNGGTISGNTATNGGGICNSNGTVTMDGGTISGNTATSGGGIYNNGGTVTISGGTIGNESATAVASSFACSNKANYGGGIYNNGGTVTLSGGNIFYNYATQHGGGIYSDAATGSELIMGSGCTTTIKYNCAATSGGGIYSGNTFTMQAGTISNNTATNGGGIFIAQGSTTTVSGGTIKDNVATRNTSNGTGGQGISVWNGTLELKGGAKIDSSNNISLYCAETGMEQHLKITGTLTETGTVATIYPTNYTTGTVVLEADDADLIADNIGKFSLPSTATNYAIAQDDTSDATKKTAVIVDNTPRETVYLDATGGSDLNDGSTKAKAVKTLTRATKLLDYAAAKPKIIIVSAYTLASTETGLLDFSARSNTVTIERWFTENTTGNYCSGKLITISSGTVVIKNVTFDGNWKADGGAGSEQLANAGSCLLYVGSGTTVTLGAGCTVKNNSSTASGGGIFNYGGTVTMNGGEIRGNRTTYDGGGIYNMGTFTLNGGTISGNSATGSSSKGGGIYNNGTLNFSGTAAVNSNNDVYLASGKFITVTSNLTGAAPIATITPETYADNTVVLKAAAAALITYNYSKFALSDSDYEIKQDTTTITNAVVASKGIETVYLDTDSGSDTNDGTTKAKAVKTLAKAVSLLPDAAGAKIVVVKPYTLASGETGLLDFSTRSNTVTIERWFTENTTGNYCSGDMLTISSGTVVIKNVTFDGNWKKNGSEQLADAGGALLYANSSGAKVTLGAGCTIKNNSMSGDGSGIYNYGTITMSGGEISGNTADDGDDGDDGDGGGIYNNGIFTMSGGTISGNSARRNGGGIYNYLGRVEMNDGTISGNSADKGGGIYNYGGTVNIEGGTVSDDKYGC